MKWLQEKGAGRLSLVLGCCALVLLLGMAVAWAAEAGVHEAPSKWPDFFQRVLNFTIMVGVLYFLLRKPLRQYFAGRTKTIANTLAELEAKKQEAEKTYQEYQQRLTQLDEETDRILQEYITQGENEKAKIIANAEKAAAEIRKQAKAAIEQEVKSAKLELRQEIAELSVVAAEKMLKEKIEEKDQQKLVQDFMTKVVESK